MNRILLAPDNVDDQGRARLTDRRAQHVRSVLRATPGDRLRVGILDGPPGEAVVETVGTGAVELRCKWAPTVPSLPPVSVLLALPRPKVMKRLWSPLAMLGVANIMLTNAVRVERNYFDTHWLDPTHYRPRLAAGLEQSGDTRLPRVSVHRRFRPLIEDSLDARVPGGCRLLAHPGPSTGLSLAAGDRHVMVAIGPEGGWTEFERDLLAAHAFVPFSLGWRRLRTDVACTSLLAVIHHELQEADHHA